MLAKLGRSTLKALDPKRALVLDDREAAGERLHMNTKQIGRIVSPGHRITADSRDSVAGAGL